jgi:threonyl-tRNA synthetase
LERFIAILCEQSGGKWDFWLSPRQIKLVTVNQECQEYAEKVYQSLLLKGYSVELDIKGDNLNKKIRKAQL